MGVTIESKFILNEEISYEIGTYACINVKEKLVKDVKYLPKNALYSDASGDFVYLIIDGNLVRKSVETGTVTDINVEIISGQKKEMKYMSRGFKLFGLAFDKYLIHRLASH